MLPLVGIAAALLPDLIKLLAGHKAGTIATDISKAVTAVTGTSDPSVAKQKLSQDPAAAAELQVKLAQLALDATKAQNDEQDKKRQDLLSQQTAEFKASLESTSGARSDLLELVKAQSPLSWVPPVVSLVVTLGFFGILAILLSPYVKTDSANQLVNITVGALVAAFSTVVNFWLGSSQGSRNKDLANCVGQVQQAVLADAARQDQHNLNQAVLKSGAEKQIPRSVAGGAAQAEAVTGKADNFEACLAITLLQEGGFSNDPGDPGGATKFGITHGVLEEWRGHPVTIDDVKALTKQDAGEIYRAKYWIPTRCADLPKGVDIQVFDFAVNSGVRRSLQHLQRITGVHDDSSLGPVTLAAVNALEPKQLIASLANDRLEYLRSLATFDRFGKGWTRRVEEVQHAAFKMSA